MNDLGRLRVAEVELVRVQLPFVRPVTTANGVLHGRDALLVHLRGAGGEDGWGECAAEPAPGYWHEYTDACGAFLRRWVLPKLDGATVGVGQVTTAAGWPMATAAVEWAVLDALCRRGGISAAAWLGATRTHVPATLTVGIGDDVDPGPYRFVKLKVGAGVEPPPLPTGVVVSADGNGSLSPDDVAALAAVGLDHLEQPLPADDLVGHADLKRTHADLRIALDESVRSAGDVRTAAALGACDIVVLKPGRVGGPLAARAVHDAAVAAGLHVKVGGMWDTGVGRAAALAVAGLPGCDVAPDLSAADRYFERDIVAAPVALDADGCLAVPSGPGLGVDVTL